MSGLDPLATTVGDLCNAALRECGAWGVGQTPLADDINDAWTRLQWMLQSWNRKRYLIYHLVDYSVVSTGAQSYTVGPGGNIDTTVGGAGATATRPDKIEYAYLRQLTQSQPNQIDYPMDLLHSYEDYAAIALKQLMSFPGAAFYDPAMPLGNLFFWPVPQASIYSCHILLKEQLPNSFANLAVKLVLPEEYFNAILYQLALRLRPKYGLGTYPGDLLPGLARDAMEVIRTGNTAIPRLKVPAMLMRPGIYNIFSDRSY